MPHGKLLGPDLMEAEHNQLTIRLPRAVEYARLNGVNQIAARTGDVPPVLVSECWHHLRLIAADGTGFDPDWATRTE